MRFTSLAKSVAVIFVALMLVFLPVANAQVLTSAVGTSTLTFVAGETLTVSGVPAALTFDPSTATTQSLNVTTTWQLVSTRTRVAMNLFFATPATALSDGAGHNITSSNIGANKNGGTFSTCDKAPDSVLTGVIPAASACNVGDSVNITTANLSSTVTSAYQLKVLNTGSLTAAGTYTGVLSYVAAAQ